MTQLWIYSPFIFVLGDNLRLSLFSEVSTVTPTQEVIYSQENSIRELLKAVSEQSQQLDLQRQKVKTLEEKVNWSQHH